MTRSVLAVLLAWTTVIAADPASAQIAVEPPPYTLRLWGEATVTVPPDSVEIAFAVTARADSAAGAASQNACVTTYGREQVAC